MLFYSITNIGILGYRTLGTFTSALQFLMFARSVSHSSFRLQYDPAFYPVLMIQAKLSTAVYCPVLLSNTNTEPFCTLLLTSSQSERHQQNIQLRSNIIS